MTDQSETRVCTDGPPEAFSIAVEPQRDFVKIAPRGELDLATTEQLRRALGELLDVGHARIVIDLRGVEFMDSSGLHALLTAHDQAQRDNWKLMIIPGRPAVQRVLEITCAIDRLPFATANGRAGSPRTPAAASMSTLTIGERRA